MPCMGPIKRERSETDPIAQDLLKYLLEKHHIFTDPPSSYFTGEYREECVKTLEDFKEMVNKLIWQSDMDGF